MFIFHFFVAALVILAILIAPAMKTLYTTTNTTSDYIIKNKIYTPSVTSGTSYTPPTYLIYMEPKSTLNVERTMYDLLNPGEICNVTKQDNGYPGFLAVTTTHIDCGGMSLDRFTFVEGVK